MVSWGRCVDKPAAAKVRGREARGEIAAGLLRRIADETKIDHTDLHSGAGPSRRLPRVRVRSGDAFFHNSERDGRQREAHIHRGWVVRETP